MKTFKNRWDLFFASLVILAILSLPALFTKIKNNQLNKPIAWVVDFEDLQYYSKTEGKDLATLIGYIRDVPDLLVAMSTLSRRKDIELIQTSGFKILWRQLNASSVNILKLKEIMREGDGLLAFEDEVLGYPDKINLFSELINRMNGFAPLVEFAPQKGWVEFARRLPGRIIRSHVLQKKEVKKAELNLWENRLVRAVRMRSIRLLYVRMCEELTFDENIEFMFKVKQRLTSK